MQPGQRDQPVYFEEPTTTNVNGELTTAWADASGDSPPTHDWAFVISERGSEAFEAARQNSRETIRLMVLYRDDIQTTWRLKWLDQYYEITAADRSKKRANELWITAQIVGKA